MLIRLIAPLFFLLSALSAIPAKAQQACPNPFIASGRQCVPITASSTGSTGAITATLAATAGKTTYICGFTFTATNATAANVSTNITVTGTIGGTMNFGFPTLAAGAAIPNPLPMSRDFDPCVAAAALNTSIVVNGPALGAGSTLTTLAAWGYYL